MQLLAALKHLWRHPGFRRLLGIRLFTQAADGTMLVGMGSYVLFSPQNQPNAWAIAGVLALTLLPFTVLGPFVSPLLDIWSRRQVVLIADIIRATMAIIVGAIIFADLTAGLWEVVLYCALLVAMSINRFVMAGLSAAMQHTVDPDEYLMASSILPTLGPLGVVVGFVIGAAIRVGFGSWLPANQADAVVFWVSAAMWVVSVLLTTGFTRAALGPDGQGRARGVVEILKGLGNAAYHLRSRTQVVLALLIMGAHRWLFGFLTVVVILAARNRFNAEPADALADLTLWGLLSGMGFVAATAFVPLVARTLGLRWAMVGFLLMGGLGQLVMTLAPEKWVIFGVSVLIGLSVQSFKIGTDTVVQSGVQEFFKGRVFVFYDVVFNASLVLAAIIAALILPVDGVSVPVYLGLTALYLSLAVIFALGSRGIERFDEAATT